MSTLAPQYPTGRSGARWPLWDQMDQSSRWLGRAMDALGFAPVETPSRIALARPPLTLKAYGDARGDGPPLLLVPAPIKRAYIWDLVPRASVVRACLRHGLRVYMVQWEPPKSEGQRLGLEQYADRFLLDCLGTVEAETGQWRVFLAGHSLGGTLAAIFAALHPERVRALVLLGAPLRFGPEVGAFGPLVAAAPPAPLLTAALGNVPGSWMDAVSLMAAPGTFVWARWVDWLESLPDARARDVHLRVARWMLEEMPLARRLFDEVVELLYREDRLMRGSLLVGGQPVAPELVEAPLLGVVRAHCPVAPVESVLPFLRATRSPETELLWHAGDVGVALEHVGMLVGETAHRRLWPEILRWIHARG